MGLKSLGKNFGNDKKRLLENFFSLSILQGANYILPLITLPYLVRVLGPEKYGLIAFAQAFIQYFIILTDYGFNLSATREISINRENKEKISEIFSSVMVIKAGLLILSFVIMLIVVFFFGKFKKDMEIYFLTFGMVIGQNLFPVWFFQGMEKMKYITFLNITAKLIFTVSIFIFIHNVSDYIYVPLINSLGFIVAGILSLWIVFRNFRIKLVIPKISVVLNYLKDSTQFFLSRVSVSIYTSSNAFVLGLFTNNIMVGYYSIAEKLYLALKNIYSPLTQVIYPYMSKTKNLKFIKKIFKMTLLINILIIIFLFITSGFLFKLLFSNQSSNESIIVFRIFLIASSVVVPSVITGYPFLAAMGYPKYANKSVIYGSVLHISMLVIFMIIGFISIYSVAVAVVITESFVFLYRLYYSRRILYE